MNCNNKNTNSKFIKQANQKILLECNNKVSDNYGGQVINNWQLLSECWAIIQPKHKLREFIDYRNNSQQLYQITIRHNIHLVNYQYSSNYRIRFDNTALNILSVINLDNNSKYHGNDFQELICGFP